MKTKFRFLRSGWGISLLLVLALTLGIVGTASAAKIVNNGSLPAGVTIDDDVIIAEDVVTVDGTVNGLLIAAGRTVTINGTINGDAIVFAQDIIIGEKAVIKDNLFVGGANVIINGKVEGSLLGGAASLDLNNTASVTRNMYFGGYSLQTQQESAVSRDLYAGAYQAILKGTVSQDVKIGANAVEFSGQIGGNATFDVGSSTTANAYFGPNDINGFHMPQPIAPGLRIDPAAKITGNLTYISPSSVNIPTTSASQVVYETPEPGRYANRANPSTTFRFEPWLPTGFWVWDLLRNMITLLLLGTLAVWLMPKLYRRAADSLAAHPLASFGIGFLAVVLSVFVFPLVLLVIILAGLLLGLLTLGGLAGFILTAGFLLLGLAVVAVVVLLTWVSKLVVAFLLGRLILKVLAPSAVENQWLSMVIGVPVFAILVSIPVLGWLIDLIAALFGLGALWYLRNRTPLAPVPAG